MSLALEILKVSKIENVYIRESLIADDVIFMSDLKNRGINIEILNYLQPAQAGNVRLTLYGSRNLGNALYVDLYSYSALFTGTINKDTFEHLTKYVFLSPQIIVAYNYAVELYNYYRPNLVLTRYQAKENNSSFYSIQHSGELIFNVENDIISKV